MLVWTLEDIERQAARGGVNRQQAEQLIRTVRNLTVDLEAANRMQEAWRKAWFADTKQLQDERDDLADAIIRHRNVWANTTSRSDQRRDDANDVLWSLVDQEDG